MIGYALRAWWVSVRGGKTLFLLSVLGVALGVASVLSIQIINQNALAAFEGSLRAVSGESDLIVTGRGTPLDERLLPAVLADRDVRAAFPIHRVDVALVGEDEFYLEVLGFDLFSSPRIPWSDEPAGFGDALFTPGWAAVSEPLAERFGWSDGDVFRVSSGSRVVELTVGTRVDFRRISALAPGRLVVMDIAQAQALTGRPGEIHQVDVLLADGADREAAAERLASALGPAAEVRTPREARDEAAGLLAAFRLNLTALSLISVLVGAFLVHSATQASLVRRRNEFGVLRSIGATRGQVLASILLEVGVLGALGFAVGVPIGWLVARWNVGFVSATISNLYLLEEIERLVLPGWLFLLAAGVGIGGALLGAALPAWDMSRRDPRALLLRSTLHEGVGRSTGGLAVVGLAIPVAAWVIYRAALVGWRGAGFVLALALLAAVPLIAPFALERMAALVPSTGFGLVSGVRALRERLSTTAFAVAALAVTVTMLVGITLMVGSFRRTVALWVDDTLLADVYVTSPSWRRARAAAWIEPEVVEALRGLPEVREVYGLRQATVQSDGRRIVVSGTDIARDVYRESFSLIEGDPRAATRAVRDDGAAIVTEPLARKAGLGVGDELPLTTPRGEVRLLVVGVAYDYSSEVGGAFVSSRAFQDIFGPGEPTNLAISLHPDVDAEGLVGRLRAGFSEHALEVRSNRDIKREVFAIFDQTFAVTRLLQAMSLLIAVAGVALTLLVLARERVSELALYRSLGATRPQIARVFLGKGLGMAACGLLVGGVAGVLLALVLIFRINRDFFGWTIAVHWPWRSLAEAVLTILLAAALASLYPAMRAGRTPATELARDDL